MLVSDATVALPSSVPGIGYNWLYCTRGPTVERPDSPALAALVAHAHKIAKKERAVVLRVEPNIADDDPHMDPWLAAYHKLVFQTNPISVQAPRRWGRHCTPDADKLLTY